jgi:hypothetical protein
LAQAVVISDLVKAMMTARILDPASKLATAASWDTGTLAETFGVEGATEDALYEAMDWLLEQQGNIEKRLAKRHLEPGGLILYDLTSPYVEGTTCPLASRGYSRDGKAHKRQINFGLLTDALGRPVAVDVYEGRTGRIQPPSPSSSQDHSRVADCGRNHELA